jgi:molybdenum cofactor biosynthesis protein B
MSREVHLRQSEQTRVRCAIVTLSDTRTLETDGSGATIERMLLDHGLEVRSRTVIPDEPARLHQVLDGLLDDREVDCVITNGGTGLSRRDQTIPVVEEFIGTLIPGFGELFRMLSFEQVGSAAMLSRAVAGVARGKLIFALPGSTKAVELAMERLILPEIRHLIHHMNK